MNFYQVSEGYLGIFIFNIANGVPVFWTALKGGQRHRTKPFIIFVAWLSKYCRDGARYENLGGHVVMRGAPSILAKSGGGAS